MTPIPTIRGPHSTALIRAGMEYAATLGPDQIETDPMMLALILGNSAAALATSDRKEWDTVARVIGCLVYDWAHRVHGAGDDAIAVLRAKAQCDDIIDTTKAAANG